MTPIGNERIVRRSFAQRLNLSPELRTPTLTFKGTACIILVATATTNAACKSQKVRVIVTTTLTKMEHLDGLTFTAPASADIRRYVRWWSD
jgi:hypothetical protein